jgi:hypothetical protein
MKVKQEQTTNGYRYLQKNGGIYFFFRLSEVRNKSNLQIIPNVRCYVYV